MTDSNEAPDGYIAKKSTNGCFGCAFHGPCLPAEDCTRKTLPSCFADMRDDKTTVIFIKKNEATIGTPIALSDVYALREKLCQDIQELLQTFQQKTSITPSEVRVNLEDVGLQGAQRLIAGVIISLEL